MNSQTGLVLPYDAEATVAPYRFVKEATDPKVAQAASAADDVVGISDYLGVTYSATAEVNTVEVKMTRIAELEFAGTVARGAKITANADGKGVAAVSTNKYYAIALEAAVSGDRKKVLLVPGNHVLA
ncbi:MAG: DUF2190 domain-containing protein [Candidatus Electrothrix sp. ATG2]|nr:DUF2190 domain-containing protein [Candidatus Electrothrix sp. ATG2]